MAEVHEFKPDWCLAPADHLREWIDVTVGGHPSVLAAACAPRERRKEALAVIERVLAREPYGEAEAALLEKGTHVPARFWLALEHNYRAGLAAGLIDASEGVASAEDGTREH